MQLLSKDLSSPSVDEGKLGSKEKLHETSEDWSNYLKHPKQIPKHVPWAHKLNVVLD